MREEALLRPLCCPANASCRWLGERGDCRGEGNPPFGEFADGGGDGYAPGGGDEYAPELLLLLVWVCSEALLLISWVFTVENEPLRYGLFGLFFDSLRPGDDLSGSAGLTGVVDAPPRKELPGPSS